MRVLYIACRDVAVVIVVVGGNRELFNTNERILFVVPSFGDVISDGESIVSWKRVIHFVSDSGDDGDDNWLSTREQSLTC